MWADFERLFGDRHPPCKGGKFAKRIAGSKAERWPIPYVTEEANLELHQPWVQFLYHKFAGTQVIPALGMSSAMVQFLGLDMCLDPERCDTSLPRWPNFPAEDRQGIEYYFDATYEALFNPNYYLPKGSGGNLDNSPFSARTFLSRPDAISGY